MRRLLPLALVTLALASSSSAGGAEELLLWRGMEHDWKRRVVGMRVPHRISLLESWLDPLQGVAHLAQGTGVDGDWMRPRLRYATLDARGLEQRRGWERLRWRDAVVDGPPPQASSLLQRALRFPWPGASPPTLLLRGVALDSACHASAQPPEEPCNSDGLWPSRLGLSLGPCALERGEAVCPLEVALDRAWTPHKGGLPPVEVKPLNRALDLELTVHWTALGGLTVTRGQPIVAEGRARARQPQRGQATLQGQPGLGSGGVALAGLQLELLRPDDRPKNARLGRYLQSLTLAVEDGPYDAETGALTVAWAAGVEVPATTVATDYRWTLQPLLLQRQAPGAFSEDEAIEGSLCIPSTDQAPAFSRWDRCGGDRRGPAQPYARPSLTPVPSG